MARDTLRMAFALDPVAAQGGALLAAVGWFEALLIGPLGTSVAVIAIAGIGFRMLTGDASVRNGLRVVVGVFILFGAPLIARGLTALAQSDEGTTIVTQPLSPSPQTRPTNPIGFDPYAGAAMPNSQ